MNRCCRLLPGLSLLLCGALLACQEAQPEAPPIRDHILLISLDTLRADHLSSYGYPRPTSPFLDQLAGEGVRFSHAFVNTHGTPPSHATLFTSLYQEEHGVSFHSPTAKSRSDVVPDDLQLLAELLREQGYATVAVTGAGFMSAEFGFDQGFEEFDAVHDLRRAKVVLERRLRSALTQQRPVFAFFHTYEVHSPYSPPRRYRKMFGSFRSTFRPSSKNLQQVQNRVADALTDEDLQRVEAFYDGGIRYTDDELSRLFNRLSKIGFLDNALVMITSDHGEELGEHGGVLHGLTLFDELLHTPMILWGKGIPAGVVDTRMVSLLDVAPTLLAAAGSRPPDWMRGRSLLEDLGGQSAEGEAVFAQYSNLLYAIRTSRWKLVEDLAAGTRSLYELRLDPREQRDVAATRPEVVQALAARLQEWRDGLVTAPVRDGLEGPLLSPELEESLRSLGYVFD